MKASAVREMQKLQMIHKSGRIWKKIMRHYTDIPFEMLEKAIEKTMVIRVEVVTITGKFHRTGKGE